MKLFFSWLHARRRNVFFASLLFSVFGYGLWGMFFDKNIPMMDCGLLR